MKYTSNSWLLLLAIIMILTGLASLSTSSLEAQNETNLALRRPTAQGPGGYWKPSNIAVDGNTSGRYGENEVTHNGGKSTDEIPAYWQVTLEAPADITEITIWNRSDCCPGTLTDMNLFVSDVPFNNTTLESSLNQEGVSHYFISGTVGENVTVPINRTGRYIRIQKSAKGNMTIAEVQVFGTQLPNSYLEDLHSHVLGDLTLSTDELKNLVDYFAFQKVLIDGETSLQTDIERLNQATQIIADYERIHGPLFTDAGTKEFRTNSNEEDGLALERTMHQVYQAVFKSVNANLMNTRPDIIEGLAFGSHQYFPGSVPTPADPNAVYEMQINASVPEDWGRPNAYSKNAARRPTGTYLAPGTIAEVIVPPELVNTGYRIRVGAHSWDLSNKSVQKRVATASLLFPITSTTTQVANPLGGNIYIEVPYLADDGIVTVQFKNTGRAPFFSARSFDQMTLEEWQTTERYHPGAWTDIESDKVMMNVPSKWIRDFDDPLAVVEAYDNGLDAISDLMGRPRVRNKTIAYMQVDVIMRGSAFYPGYPMGNYPSFASNTPQAPLNTGHVFNAVFLHEHGHATYVTKFSNETEAAVHMPAVYLYSQLRDMPLQEAFSRSLHYYDKPDVTLTDAFNTWALRDTFIDNKPMLFHEGGYRHAGHADYVEMVDLFGWDAFTNFNRQLHIDYEETGYDFNRNNHNPNDRILRFSREAGADLRPLFHMWGAIPTDQETLQAQLDAEGLLPSALIYDRMVAYKSTIPLTQAEFDELYAEMRPVLAYGPDFWDVLKEEYPRSRGEAAIARLDELIDYYFPNGRPAVEPTPEPTSALPTATPVQPTPEPSSVPPIDTPLPTEIPGTPSPEVTPTSMPPVNQTYSIYFPMISKAESNRNGSVAPNAP